MALTQSIGYQMGITFCIWGRGDELPCPRRTGGTDSGSGHKLQFAVLEVIETVCTVVDGVTDQLAKVCLSLFLFTALVADQIYLRT